MCLVSFYTYVGYCSSTVTFADARGFDNTKGDGEASMKRFKFYLAMENMFCTDYITEKVRI